MDNSNAKHPNPMLTKYLIYGYMKIWIYFRKWLILKRVFI